MTGLAAACVVLAAAVVVFPRPGRRARRLRILQPTPPRSTGRLVAGGLNILVRRFHSSGRDRGVRRPPAAGRPPRAWMLQVLVPVIAAAAAVIVGGVVAGAMAGAYAVVAARLMARHRAERARTDHRSGQLDLLAAAAADLRAGLPAGAALAGICDDRGDPLASRVRAAALLAERTGAPLASVLEQIEADTRGVDRARAGAAAQTAGSRATAWLLAGLPFGGIGLGYAIGTDPLAVLLHTPVGAVCALGAVGLQLAGLAWAARIARTVPAVGS